MEPEIKNIGSKKLAGKSLIMSLTENRTADLWKSFMPRQKEITNNLSNDLFSLQIYDNDYFTDFRPDRKFEKWALAEVEDFNSIPDGMKTFELPAGMYAVFKHKGTETGIFNYIFSEWLPNSGFQIDNRPHFEVLGEKYRNGSPDSEEEIWIPVKPKF